MTVETVNTCTVATTRQPGPINISYKLLGNGPQRVILIMGISASGNAWLPQAQAFAKHEFQVCIFDNRGVGYSDAPCGYYTTKDMAHDTRELLDHLGWRSDVHVVGSSMGGMIALELVSMYPEYISTLCLTSTHAGMTIPPLIGAITMPRTMMMMDVEKRISMQCNMLFPRAWLEQPSSKDPKKTNEEQMLELFKERIIETPVQSRNGVIGQLSAVVRHHIGRDRLIKIRDTGIPILVCTGTDDKLVRPSNSYYIADVLQARLEVFQDCGHVLSLQEPERYNDLLLEHFRSIKPIKIIATE